MNCTHAKCHHDKPALGHCAFVACPNYRGSCPEHTGNWAGPGFTRRNSESADA